MLEIEGEEVAEFDVLPPVDVGVETAGVEATDGEEEIEVVTSTDVSMVEADVEVTGTVYVAPLITTTEGQVRVAISDMMVEG